MLLGTLQVVENSHVLADFSKVAVIDGINVVNSEQFQYLGIGLNLA